MRHSGGVTQPILAWIVISKALLSAPFPFDNPLLHQVSHVETLVDNFLDSTVACKNEGLEISVNSFYRRGSALAKVELLISITRSPLENKRHIESLPSGSK